MGHAVFLLLHGVAACLGCWLLLVTIPLHMIYAAVRAKQ